jgi:hypothetical protein
MKKVLTILLVVLFLVSLTALAASAVGADDSKPLKNRDGTPNIFRAHIDIKQPSPVPEEVVKENARSALTAKAMAFIDQINNSPVPGPTISFVDILDSSIDLSNVQFTTHVGVLGDRHSEAQGDVTGQALVHGL